MASPDAEVNGGAAPVERRKSRSNLPSSKSASAGAVATPPEGCALAAMAPPVADPPTPESPVPPTPGVLSPGGRTGGGGSGSAGSPVLLGVDAADTSGLGGIAVSALSEDTASGGRWSTDRTLHEDLDEMRKIAAYEAAEFMAEQQLNSTGGVVGSGSSARFASGRLVPPGYFPITTASIDTLSTSEAEDVAPAPSISPITQPRRRSSMVSMGTPPVYPRRGSALSNVDSIGGEPAGAGGSADECMSPLSRAEAANRRRMSIEAEDLAETEQEVAPQCYSPHTDASSTTPTSRPANQPVGVFEKRGGGGGGGGASTFSSLPDPAYSLVPYPSAATAVDDADDAAAAAAAALTATGEEAEARVASAAHAQVGSAPIRGGASGVGGGAVPAAPPSTTQPLTRMFSEESGPTPLMIPPPAAHGDEMSFADINRDSDREQEPDVDGHAVGVPAGDGGGAEEQQQGQHNNGFTPLSHPSVPLKAFFSLPEPVAPPVMLPDARADDGEGVGGNSIQPPADISPRARRWTTPPQYGESDTARAVRYDPAHASGVALSFEGAEVDVSGAASATASALPGSFSTSTTAATASSATARITSECAVVTAAEQTATAVTTTTTTTTPALRARAAPHTPQYSQSVKVVRRQEAYQSHMGAPHTHPRDPQAHAGNMFSHATAAGARASASASPPASGATPEVSVMPLVLGDIDEEDEIVQADELSLDFDDGDVDIGGATPEPLERTTTTVEGGEGEHTTHLPLDMNITSLTQRTGQGSPGREGGGGVVYGVAHQHFRDGTSIETGGSLPHGRGAVGVRVSRERTLAEKDWRSDPHWEAMEAESYTEFTQTVKHIAEHASPRTALEFLHDAQRRVDEKLDRSPSRSRSVQASTTFTHWLATHQHLMQEHEAADVTPARTVTTLATVNGGNASGAYAAGVGAYAVATPSPTRTTTPPATRGGTDQITQPGTGGRGVADALSPAPRVPVSFATDAYALAGGGATDAADGAGVLDSTLPSGTPLPLNGAGGMAATTTPGPAAGGVVVYAPQGIVGGGGGDAARGASVDAETNTDVIPLSVPRSAAGREGGRTPLGDVSAAHGSNSSQHLSVPRRPLHAGDRTESSLSVSSTVHHNASPRAGWAGMSLGTVMGRMYKPRDPRERRGSANSVHSNSAHDHAPPSSRSRGASRERSPSSHSQQDRSERHHAHPAGAAANGREPQMDSSSHARERVYHVHTHTSQRFRVAPSRDVSPGASSVITVTPSISPRRALVHSFADSAVGDYRGAQFKAPPNSPEHYALSQPRRRAELRGGAHGVTPTSSTVLRRVGGGYETRSHSASPLPHIAVSPARSRASAGDFASPTRGGAAMSDLSIAGSLSVLRSRTPVPGSTSPARGRAASADTRGGYISHVVGASTNTSSLVVHPASGKTTYRGVLEAQERARRRAQSATQQRIQSVPPSAVAAGGLSWYSTTTQAQAHRRVYTSHLTNAQGHRGAAAIVASPAMPLYAQRASAAAASSTPVSVRSAREASSQPRRGGGPAHGVPASATSVNITMLQTLQAHWKQRHHVLTTLRAQLRRGWAPSGRDEMHALTNALAVQLLDQQVDVATAAADTLAELALILREDYAGDAATVVPVLARMGAGGGQGHAGHPPVPHAAVQAARGCLQTLMRHAMPCGGVEGLIAVSAERLRGGDGGGSYQPPRSGGGCFAVDMLADLTESLSARVNPVIDIAAEGPDGRLINESVMLPQQTTCAQLKAHFAAAHHILPAGVTLRHNGVAIYDDDARPGALATHTDLLMAGMAPQCSALLRHVDALLHDPAAVNAVSTARLFWGLYALFPTAVEEVYNRRVLEVQRVLHQHRPARPRVALPERMLARNLTAFQHGQRQLEREI